MQFYAVSAHGMKVRHRYNIVHVSVSAIETWSSRSFQAGSKLLMNETEKSCSWSWDQQQSLGFSWQMWSSQCSTRFHFPAELNTTTLITIYSENLHLQTWGSAEIHFTAVSCWKFSPCSLMFIVQNAATQLNQRVVSHIGLWKSEVLKTISPLESAGMVFNGRHEDFLFAPRDFRWSCLATSTRQLSALLSECCRPLTPPLKKALHTYSLNTSGGNAL
jgi:hypothetical protein